MKNKYYLLSEADRDIAFGVIEADIEATIKSYLKYGGSASEGELIKRIKREGLVVNRERFRCAAERMVAKWQLSREYDEHLKHVICQLTNKKTELAKQKKMERTVELLTDGEIKQFLKENKPEHHGQKEA